MKIMVYRFGDPVEFNDGDELRMDYTFNRSALDEELETLAEAVATFMIPNEPEATKMSQEEVLLEDYVFNLEQDKASLQAVVGKLERELVEMVERNIKLETRNEELTAALVQARKDIALVTGHYIAAEKRAEFHQEDAEGLIDELDLH